MNSAGIQKSTKSLPIHFQALSLFLFSLRAHLNVGSAKLDTWEIRRQAVFLGSPALHLTLTHVTPVLTVLLRGTGMCPVRYAYI